MRDAASLFRGGSQMRDPDLVTRAQRAAVALERAWERWRAMHGLSAEPMQPVSSYVGYSIEEPWGRPRVVFGVDAREAELLAALLDHHECVGPFYQADPSDAARTGPAGKDGSPLDEARSRIPAQAQAAEERTPQRWGQDAGPGAADGGPDGLAGDDHGAEPRYPDRPSAQENGAVELPRPDETRGDSGRPGDHRRGRRAEVSKPSRRERRTASRQRSAGPREPMTEAVGPDAVDHDPDSLEAEASWPPDVPGLSWPGHEAEPAGGAPEHAGGAPASPAAGSPALDSTTVDSIPVQGAAATPGSATPDSAAPDSAIPDNAAPVSATPDSAAPDGAAQDERAPRGRSLYDVTRASRERRRDPGRGRGAGQADRRQSAARDLGQLRAADAGRGGKPSAEPVSSNGVTGTGHTDAGLGPAAAGPTSLDPAGPAHIGRERTGRERTGATAADQAQHGRGDGTAQDRSYPAPDGQEYADDAGAQRAGAAAWAQDSDPGFGYSTGQGLQYGSAGQGLDYGDDAGLDYAGDADQDYPGDDSWDDMAGQGEAWGTGLADTAAPAADSNGDPGRSDVAGLDQLWDIGRAPAGHGQDHVPDAPARQSHDAAGPVRDGAVDTSQGDAGLGGAHSNGAAGHGSAARDAGPGPARETGPVPDGGPARDTRPAREAGPGGEGGSAWDTRPAREAGPGGEGGSAWDTRPAREAGPARDAGSGSRPDARRDLPGDFGPDPLGVRASRESADFLAAPPPASSILTAPPPESRTARPGSVGTETIAAELAGWAAGELPGQASARLAAWAAIGGVPAAGYDSTDGSDLGPAGVATERVR